MIYRIECQRSSVGGSLGDARKVMFCWSRRFASKTGSNVHFVARTARCIGQIENFADLQVRQVSIAKQFRLQVA